MKWRRILFNGVFCLLIVSEGYIKIYDYFSTALVFDFRWGRVLLDIVFGIMIGLYFAYPKIKSLISKPKGRYKINWEYVILIVLLLFFYEKRYMFRDNIRLVLPIFIGYFLGNVLRKEEN